jgi:hypothetical protein
MRERSPFHVIVRMAGEKSSALIAFGHTSPKITQHNTRVVHFIDERMELLSACGQRITRLEKLAPLSIHVQAYQTDACDRDDSDRAIHDACLEISQRTDP